jgi:tetratricopeptide (TPR) repeat protein
VKKSFLVFLFVVFESFPTTSFAQTYDRILGDWYYTKSLSQSGLPLPTGPYFREISFAGKRWAKLIDPIDKDIRATEYQIVQDSLRFFLTNSVLDPVFLIYRLTFDELVLRDKYGYHVFSRIIRKVKEGSHFVIFLKKDTIIENSKKTTRPIFKEDFPKYLMARLSHLSADSASMIASHVWITKTGRIERVKIYHTKQSEKYNDTIKATLLGTDNRWFPARAGAKRVPYAVTIGIPLFSRRLNQTDIVEEMYNLFIEGRSLQGERRFEEALKSYTSSEVLFEFYILARMYNNAGASSTIFNKYSDIVLATGDLLTTLGRYEEACRTYRKIADESSYAMEQVGQLCK